MSKKLEPRVNAADGTQISYSAARTAWENSEFSDWADLHGFPLMIDGVEYNSWEGIECTLSDDQYDQIHY